MKFLKYPSLTNHYNVQGSRNILAQLDQEYAMREKLDGTNISVTIDVATGDYQFAKRNSLLPTDKPLGSPYDALSELLTPAFVAEINERIAVYSAFDDVAVHVFGELFGAGIQKQHYTITKEGRREVLFYDILIESEDGTLRSLSLPDFEYVIPESFRIPVIKTDTLKNLLQLPIATMTDSDFGGTLEGYVFHPVAEFTYRVNAGDYPVVKFKTDAYAEVKKVNRPERKGKSITPTYPDVYENMERYVTEQRVMNIVSHGDFALVPKSIGPLIKEMNQDIEKEFLAENPAINQEEAHATLSELRRPIAQTVKSTVMNQ